MLVARLWSGYSWYCNID